MGRLQRRLLRTDCYNFSRRYPSEISFLTAQCSTPNPPGTHFLGFSYSNKLRFGLGRYHPEQRVYCFNVNGQIHVGKIYHSLIRKSTWSYENRVRKYFVIILNFSCLTACLLCCLLMSFFFFLLVLWLGICQGPNRLLDLCRSRCRQNYYLALPPSLPFFPYPQFSL